jgi:hypothetical protein
MSFFSWFGRKSSAPESEPHHSSELGQADATVPMHPSGQHQAQLVASAETSGSRADRLERREMLYVAVRECMTGAGVLSSTYKFKVLSLDSAGRKYLIMVDIPQQVVADPARFAEIEGAIARSAKERFGILVTAVYWRVNELVSTGTRQTAPRPQVENVDRVNLAKPLTTAVPAERDAVLEEEVLAFKRAVATAASAAAANRSGETIRSGRRNPQPLPDFSDTEPFDASSPLGPSQFGGLN